VAQAIQRVCVLAVVAALGGAATAGDAMAAVWSQPSFVARANRPVRIVAAGVAANDAVVVWEAYDVAGRETTDFRLSAASGPVGARLAPQPLDRTDDDPDPTLAVSAAGYAALVWDDGPHAVKVAVRPPGGAFGRPLTIPTDGSISTPIRVGVDDAGNVTVLWTEFGSTLSGQGPLRFATVLADGTVTAARTLDANASPVSWVFLAVASRGDAVAAWFAYADPASGATGESRVALRPAGGEFGPASAFGDPAGRLYPTAATIDPEGLATVQLRRFRIAPPSDPGAVVLVQGTTAGGWSAPQPFDPNADVRFIGLSANARGDRIAVWDTQPTYWPYQPGATRVSRAPAGQPFAAPAIEPERAPLAATDPSLLDVVTSTAVTSDGEALVLWDGPVLGMQVHPLAPSGQAEPPEPVLQDACRGGGGILAAGGPPGAAVAVWQAGRDGQIWVTYRNAGAPAQPARPRVCQLLFSPRVPGAGVVVRSGRVDLTVRLSKPVARVAVTVRTAPGGSRAAGHPRRARVLGRQRLGAHPTGYVVLTLRGAHGARRLSPGRYRVSAQAVDSAGRRSALASATIRVERRRTAGR
jgi:hypothetical protein